jgi:hypothetical protein
VLALVRFWILLSALLVSAGWILSALHKLNRAGYGVVFALAAIAFIWWRRKTNWHPRKKSAQLFHQFRRRFKRPAPLLFLLLALLALLSGSLYPALNYDADAYRLPRVFHWLWFEQWHWIHTFDARLNISACGFEWLSAPLILFTRTDRFLFLINWISFLMLPGLIFSVFTRLQVRPRVAWWWMWFLASGWCFALQAGSIANDSFAAIYILAAVDLALRAQEKNSVTDLWLSLLAAALATGAKQTNIPLALLWVIAAWPSLRLLRTRPIITVLIAAGGLLVSIVPISVLNYQHYGTWLPLEESGVVALGKFHLNPFWGVVGNAFCIPAENLLPPFFPWTDSWNAMMDRFMQTPFGSHFSSFEHFGILSLGTHGVGEANAGIGLGICVLVLVSLWSAWRYSKTILTLAVESSRLPWLLRVAPWALLLLFMAKVGTFQNARQLSPYYPFFFPLLLAGTGQAQLVRRIWWQRLGLLVMAVTAVILVGARNRPLFPAQTVLDWLRSNHPDSRFISRIALAYEMRSTVENEQHCFTKDFPPGERVIGFIPVLGGSEAGFETGLWLPFGQRRVEWVLPDDPPEKFQLLDIHYVVVEEEALDRMNETVEQWMNQFDGELVDQFALKQSHGSPLYIYLVHLRSK